MNQQDETESTPEQSADLNVGRRDLLKLTGAGIAALGVTLVVNIPLTKAQDMSNGAANFYTSDKVTLQTMSSS